MTADARAPENARNPILVLGGLMLLSLGAVIVGAVLASGGNPASLLVVGGLLVLGGVVAIGTARRVGPASGPLREDEE